jgi:UDP-N-acetylglucosamine 2-epimerase (non-hydrolysing)
LKPKKPIRILAIYGTRPEAVKMAPVTRVLKETPGVQMFTCVTAQHRQMLDQVLNAFDIRPEFDLDIMQPDQTLSQISAAVFTHLDPVLTRVNPDWVLVQGDTTTVLAASICAAYRHIKVGHVEAGLRTHDKTQPFPEEINRRVASAIADLHFAPTEWSRDNLLREGIPADTIHVTGNPVIDALRWITQLPEPADISQLIKNLQVGGDGGNRLVLVTAHRRENFGRSLEQICTAINTLADEYQGKVQFVYPVHLNPNVQEPVYRMLRHNLNITLLPPLDYLPLIHLMKHATLILTDSGGIQEEAPGLGKPALVMREVTERPEGVMSGVLKLVGTDTDRIIHEAQTLLNDETAYRMMAKASNPFGDGYAAERIRDALLAYHARGDRSE